MPLSKWMPFVLAMRCALTAALIGTSPLLAAAQEDGDVRYPLGWGAEMYFENHDVSVEIAIASQDPWHYWASDSNWGYEYAYVEVSAEIPARSTDRTVLGRPRLLGPDRRRPVH